jgi:hypothetical protein
MAAIVAKTIEKKKPINNSLHQFVAGVDMRMIPKGCPTLGTNR